MADVLAFPGRWPGGFPGSWSLMGGGWYICLPTFVEPTQERPMKSVNKVILVGHLGKDPEVKYTPQGTPVAKFSIATNERYKDKQGEWQDRTEWHNITAWQRLAEIAGEYLKKGSQVYVEGRLRTDSWDDKESGQKKYRTEIVINDMVLLGGRGQGGDEFSGGNRSRGASAAASFDQRGPEDVAQGAQITDDDIPF
jgi:single-strand DNA-binding protein